MFIVSEYFDLGTDRRLCCVNWIGLYSRIIRPLQGSAARAHRVYAARDQARPVLGFFPRGYGTVTFAVTVACCHVSRACAAVIGRVGNSYLGGYLSVVEICVRIPRPYSCNFLRRRVPQSIETLRAQSPPNTGSTL